MKWSPSNVGRGDVPAAVRPPPGSSFGGHDRTFGRRHAIGTYAELELLHASVSGPLRGISELAEPASTRTSARRLVVGLVLFLGSSAVARMSGWWQWLAMRFGWTGLSAFSRGRRAPAAAETSTTVGSRESVMVPRNVDTASMSVGELFVAA